MHQTVLHDESGNVPSLHIGGYATENKSLQISKARNYSLQNFNSQIKHSSLAVQRSGMFLRSVICAYVVQRVVVHWKVGVCAVLHVRANLEEAVKSTPVHRLIVSLRPRDNLQLPILQTDLYREETCTLTVC